MQAIPCCVGCTGAGPLLLRLKQCIPRHSFTWRFSKSCTRVFLSLVRTRKGHLALQAVGTTGGSATRAKAIFSEMRILVIFLGTSTLNSNASLEAGHRLLSSACTWEARVFAERRRKATAGCFRYICVTRCNTNDPVVVSDPPVGFPGPRTLRSFRPSGTPGHPSDQFREGLK